MPLNPAIALAARPVEIADPMAMYGKIAAIQQAQNQNALAQRQMQEYDRSLQESEGVRNRLAGGAKIDDPATYNFLLGSKTGREILKQEIDLRKERTLQQKTEGDLFDQRMKLIQNEWGKVRTVEDALRIHYATHADPLINEMLARAGSTEESGRQYILNAAKEGPEAFQNFVRLAQLGAAEFAKLNKPTTMQINRGGQTDLIQVPGMGGAPTTVGAYADVPDPEQVHVQKVAEYRAGVPQVYVNTPVAKSLAAPVGARAEVSLAKAEGATGMMESANMVREALNTGNVIAGPLAGARTKFAQVLEMAGAGDKDKLVATRNVIQGLATLTLESRAELKGQGQVTVDEQKLLERARSGSI